MCPSCEGLGPLSPFPRLENRGPGRGGCWCLGAGLGEDPAGPTLSWACPHLHVDRQERPGGASFLKAAWWTETHSLPGAFPMSGRGSEAREGSEGQSDLRFSLGLGFSQIRGSIPGLEPQALQPSSPARCGLAGLSLFPGVPEATASPGGSGSPLDPKKQKEKGFVGSFPLLSLPNECNQRAPQHRPQQLSF